MKSSWNKRLRGRSVLNFVLSMLCLLSIVAGGMAFRGHTMDLRLAFYSIMGLLLVIALKQ